MEEEQTYQLPPRPKPGKPSKDSRPITLVSNHFFVDTQKCPKRIYVWAIKVEPKIEQDNRKMRDEILLQCIEKLKGEIGESVYSGFNLFSYGRVPTSESVELSQLASNDVDYKVTFLKKSTLIFDSLIESENENDRNLVLRWLNIQMKRFLKLIGYTEMGRACRYYDKSRSTNPEGTQLLIHPGFETSYNIYEGGLFLKVDTSNKIVHKTTVLQLVDNLYQNKQSRSNDDMRELVKEVLIGKTVCCNYGNFRLYRIQDVVFDKKVSEVLVDEESKQSLLQYYKAKYQIDVLKDRQPLLYVETNKKTKQMGYVLPELCIMTGIPDDINDFQRRKVLACCQKTADEKIKAIENLIRQLKEPPQQGQINVQVISEKLGITIQSKAFQLQGKQLRAPKIHFKNMSIEDKKCQAFIMRNEKFWFTTPNNVKWALIYTHDFNKSNFEKTFYENSQNYGFNLDPPKYYELPKQGRCSDDIECYIDKEDQLDIILIIVPKRFKNDYTRIKTKCVQNKPISIQWCLKETLDKNFGSILGKIMQQMSPKTGGYLWKVEPQCGFPANTLLIGGAVTKDKKTKGHTIAAIVSTRNPEFTKWYNCSIMQESGTDLIENINIIIKDCCKAYYKASGGKAKPQRIIYMREGVCPSSQKAFIQIEQKQILQAIKELYADQLPEIAICLVDKKPTQKFFTLTSSQAADNPPSGTVINEKIVNKNYEFRMIAQNVGNRGTATPTQYTFLFNSTTLSEGEMEDFIFSQCFNYSNWNGPVRVPSVVQYATKLGALVANHTHICPVNEKLSENLWFL